jgi:hypothetical protein
MNRNLTGLIEENFTNLCDFHAVPLQTKVRPKNTRARVAATVAITIL